MLFGPGCGSDPSSVEHNGSSIYHSVYPPNISIANRHTLQQRSAVPQSLKGFAHSRTTLVDNMLQPNGNPSDLVSPFSYHHAGQHHLNSVSTSMVTSVPVTRLSDAKSTTHMSDARDHHASNVSPCSNSTNSNEVRKVMLCSVPIVSLVMDGQERLCLAQISNTLLKRFSYNEIHNRRVALGITCVQCTPVQLELLRRAGAMPVSSRRCGMITKREAERLCKSFLAEAEPPKLPDTFSFHVYHACAWGCRGSFTPSRYNSSRAKCIKCLSCGLFFSPNKFIFHSHQMTTSKYVQPDAANFNSWRRHIKLVTTPEPPEHVSFAWEDVKAMFNGGSRKRAMSTTLNSFTKNQESKNHLGQRQSALKYRYNDDNSGLDDSDDYGSLDASPLKKPILSPTGSFEGNNPNENALERTSPNLSHPYPQFAQQMNASRGLLESHFKKAFEVNSLIGRGPAPPPPTSGQQLKPIESRKELQSRSPVSPSRASLSTSQMESKGPTETMGSSSFSPIESYLESVKNGTLNKCPIAGAHQSTGSIGHQSAASTSPYLAHPSSTDQALMASYNGLLSGPHFGDPRLAASNNPALLNTLLGGMQSEPTAAVHHLRSGILPSSYVQLSGPMRLPSSAVSSATDLSSSALLSPVSAGSSTTPTQGDFRHNIAEFMWSMAQKAGPTPYNFLWHSTGTQSTSSALHHHPSMANVATVPVSTALSTTSSSSTPALSPNQSSLTTTDPHSEAINGGGGLFAFKPPNNADEIRKTLILNSQFFQHPRNTSGLSQQLHPSANMSAFLPNLIGNRMMAGNASTTFTGTNYMLTKENSNTEANQARSPESVPPSPASNASLPAMSSPLFPFRSAFVAPNTTAPGLDRFSSEMLAARNQFLFDAYHNAASNGTLTNGRTLFHPNMFLEKHRFEGNNNETTRDDSEKSIDVIGDEVENTMPTLTALKSIYNPFTYSKTHFTGKVLNGVTKQTRRSNKSDGYKTNKKAKQRNAKKKFNDDLLVLEEDSEVMPELNNQNHVIIRDGETPNGKQSDENNHSKELPLDECSGSNDEILCDVEERSNSPVTNRPKQCSPMEFVSSQESAKPDGFHTFGSSSSDSHTVNTNGSNEKIFLLLNNGQENGNITPSTESKQILKLVT